MSVLRTPRLILKPFNKSDYKKFIETMLTDARVVTFYYSYQGLTDIEKIEHKAEKDFWNYFEKARANGLEIWAAYQHGNLDTLVGWSGLVLSELTDRYGGFELQYMLGGDFHGLGLATELGKTVMDHAKSQLKLDRIVATVDVPNVGSIRVIEKLGFEFINQIEIYGSTEMYLYEKQL